MQAHGARTIAPFTHAHGLDTLRAVSLTSDRYGGSQASMTGCAAQCTWPGRIQRPRSPGAIHPFRGQYRSGFKGQIGLPFSLTACSSWPIKSDRRPQPVSAKGAPPIVVVGTTRDPATPLSWAQGLARQLDSGVLVVRDGDGHTGYNQGNPCTDHAVENYLVADKVPHDGLRC